MSSSTNSAGGEVWTSVGEISQNDFAGIVNGGLMKGGDVNILSGVHGLASGEMVADLSLYNADIATFGRMPGVNIYNIPEMTAGEISKVLKPSNNNWWFLQQWRLPRSIPVKKDDILRGFIRI
ncbi:hypothetical protein [Methylocystis heyeri]|uniref:hypothetical protein n=1 Tax=Methylocystis heyeri TaxID=391905 RepID=UPI00138985A1|nr:hypothetical protein [Methylocystis heyeri]